MRVLSVRTEGLLDAPALADLGALVRLPSGPPGRAIAAALGLWAASLGGDDLPGLLVSLGLASSTDGVDVTEERGVPVGVSWDLVGASASLREPGQRRFGVEVTVALDPPLFAALREEAVRDPRLIQALGHGLRMRVKVGWMLTLDGLSATIGVLGLRVGTVDFPVTGSDAAPWAPRVLAKLGRRVGRVCEEEPLMAVVERVRLALRGPDPSARVRAQRLCDALARAPFRSGRLALVDQPLVDLADLVVPVFGDALVPLARFGPAAAHALRLTEAALLRQPDVLMVQAVGGGAPRPAGLVRWLTGCVNGPDATLEQVWLVAGGGP